MFNAKLIKFGLAALLMSVRLVFAASGCEGLPAAGPAVDYATQIQPIFTNSCATTNCHRPPGPDAGLNLVTGASYAAIVGVNSSQPGKKQVNPGSAATSYLFEKINCSTPSAGSRMPDNGPPFLTQAQQVLIRDWINQGALNTNSPPTITSGPTANPNAAVIGQQVTFTVNATDPDKEALTFSWNFDDGTAAGSGNPVNHTFQIAKTCNVVVTVTDARNATTTGNVNITISPIIVTVAASDATAAEPGADVGRFTVTRNTATSSPLTVSFSLDGSATPGNDYAVPGASVVIPANQTTATVTVTALADALSEGDESVQLTLTASAAYTLGVPSTATVTIIDLPTVTLTETDVNASEIGPDVGKLTISRTGNTGAPLTVSFNIDGAANVVTDYSQIGISIVIPAGSSSVALTITPVPENDTESDETVIITIAADSTYTLGGFTSGTVTIADRPVVSIEATDASAAEDGLTTGTLTFTRSGALNSTVTVDLSIGGTANAGADYEFIDNSIVFLPTVTSITVTITPKADVLAEADEAVDVGIVSSTNYGISGSSSAIVTISDIQTFTVAATDAQAAEGASNTGTFTFTRTNGSSTPTLLKFTVGGTATDGSDYETLSHELTFAPGTSSLTVAVTPLPDAETETDETVIITLQADAAYNIGAANSATVTIADLPTINVVATDDTASEPGGDKGAFTITRTGNLTGALTVVFALQGTATQGTDYSNIGNTVVIASGEASLAVSVTPLDDTDQEGAETVILALTGNSTYNIGGGSFATVTMQDNDNPNLPDIAIAATDGLASEVGASPGQFTVTRSGAGGTDSVLTVSFTISGSAANGIDYATIESTAAIPAGSSNASITITPLADSVIDGSETVTLTLSSDPAYNLSTQSLATVVITDQPFALLSGIVASANPAVPGQPVQFTAATNAPATFQWSFGDGATGSTGPSITHSFATIGTFVVSVSATATGATPEQTLTTSLTMTVQSQTGPNVDSDSDGFPDELEIALSKLPFDANSTPFTNNAHAGQTQTLDVAKLAIKLNFAKPNLDSLSFSGTIPIPANFAAAGSHFVADVGGVIRNFTLDSKGGSKLGADTLKLSIKAKGGVVAAQTGKYAVKFSKGNYAAALTDEGLTNANVSKENRTVTVIVLFEQKLFRKDQPQIYTAKQGKSGATK